MPIADRIKKQIAEGNYHSRAAAEKQALEKQYGSDNIFDLSVSSPILEPPAAFTDELKTFVDLPQTGKHRYMENAGYTYFRSRIADQLKNETGLDFKMGQVIITAGASGALNAVFKALFNPGEELIAFAPVYPVYIPFVENYGGVCKVLPAMEELETAVTPQTKAIIINSPNNPCGLMYSSEMLEGLADILTRKSNEYHSEIYAICDETYVHMVFEGRKCPRMLNHYVNTITLTSYSAELSIGGERLGYAAVHPDCLNSSQVFGALIHANRTLGFVNSPALIQNVVNRMSDTSVYVNLYERKRNFLYESLSAAGYLAIKPDAGIFMLVKSPIDDDRAFVRELIKQKILTIPGSEFQAPGFFRVSYCVDDALLEGALAGFKKALESCNTSVNERKTDRISDAG
jgi:aspartate aminotransferase